MRNLIKVLFALAIALSPAMATAAAGDKRPVPPAVTFDINQSVIKQPLADGVSADDAIEAMKSKAVALNMKFVAHQPLSQELQARGIKSGRLEIFQFCNPMDAYEMVKHNPVFAAYMPCRIALVEDQDGKMWVMMLNLDMLINNTPLPPDVKAVAERVNSTLKSILDSAAAGEF
jgi:uncharacterized protein (DUF302 family)